MYIDTHAHLTDSKFNDIKSIVEEYQQNKVDKVITMACNVNDSKDCLNLAKKYESVYFGVGIHPQDAKEVSDSDLLEILSLAKHEKCVCIGEIGLDYYWDKTYNETQKQVLIKQLEIAKQLKLPFSFHSREATEDTLVLLKQNKNLLEYGGVLHCYSGSRETAKEILNLGLKLGFGGTLTFKNSKTVKEVFNYVPIDTVVTETDCPYLSPEPFRGKINTPKNIPIIVEFMAKEKNMQVEELAKIIYKNTSELFAFKNAKQSQK